MRIDVYLFENGFFESREKAKNAVLSGRVSLCGKIVTQPSHKVCDGCQIDIVPLCGAEYVSRGGIKLEGALEHFKADVTGKTAVDVGASTGGFTDCLLQRGAKKVFAVDCGKGQLHKKLLSDKRVVLFENVNARNLNAGMFDETIDIAVMDLSFISQTLVLEAVKSVLKDGGELISLIKPQFEVGKANISKNGIVKNEKARLDAIDKVLLYAKTLGFENRGVMTSPIEGGDGNTEYLAYFILKK